MQISGSIALVTGANRGIGRAIVEALLARGAAKVYAAGRDAAGLAEVVALDPTRVSALALDVTDAASVAGAAAAARDVTLLINNAGHLEFGGTLGGDAAALERQFSVNVFGPLHTAQAFAPALTARGGAIVNLLSIVARAAMPGIALYSASKAAALSLTQGLRAELAGAGVTVHSVFPGPVDTRMAADIDLPKTSPADVAAAILDGVEAGHDDIYPDPMSRQVAAGWASDPKAVERQFAA